MPDTKKSHCYESDKGISQVNIFWKIMSLKWWWTTLLQISYIECLLLIQLLFIGNRQIGFDANDLYLIPNYTYRIPSNKCFWSLFNFKALQFGTYHKASLKRGDVLMFGHFLHIPGLPVTFIVCFLYISFISMLP